MRAMVATVGTVLSCMMLVGCATAWKNAERQNTRQVYTAFLARYPDDRHSNQARQSIKRIDDFARARQIDKKTEYVQFIDAYTTNSLEGKLVSDRLSELENPTHLPDALRDNAAKCYASGNKYYIWQDENGGVSLLGETNAVWWVMVSAYAIAAPGGDCPVFLPVISIPKWDSKEKKSLTASWSMTYYDHGIGFAGSNSATMFSALWHTLNLATGTISGRGPVMIALIDRDTFCEKAEDKDKWKLISNVLVVNVDCANAGKHRLKQASATPPIVK